jgi:fluoroacetyl-CoA thioesterase
MQPTLQVGNRAEIQIEVTMDMCPAFDDVVVHKVYSTWSMAHHMELAARLVLVDHLEAHEEGIGSHLSIDHVSPAPVGSTVRVVAEAVSVDHRGVECEVVAWDGDRVIGRGRQVQRVLPRTTLARLIERHQ